MVEEVRRVVVDRDRARQVTVDPAARAHRDRRDPGGRRGLDVVARVPEEHDLARRQPDTLQRGLDDVRRRLRGIDVLGRGRHLEQIRRVDHLEQRAQLVGLRGRRDCHRPAPGPQRVEERARAARRPELRHLRGEEELAATFRDPLADVALGRHARDERHDPIAAHADQVTHALVAELDPSLAQRIEPRPRVGVDAVDERSVDVQQDAFDASVLDWPHACGARRARGASLRRRPGGWVSSLISSSSIGAASPRWDCGRSGDTADVIAAARSVNSNLYVNGKVWDHPTSDDDRRTRRPTRCATDRLLRIQEVAAETGLTTRAVRYYEEVGLLRPAARSGGDYRLYDASDLERLQYIKNLRDVAGFSIAEIEGLLEDEDVRARNRAAYQATEDPARAAPPAGREPRAGGAPGDDAAREDRPARGDGPRCRGASRATSGRSWPSTISEARASRRDGRARSPASAAIASGARSGTGTTGCSSSGQLISLIGTWMQTVAQGWLVLQLTGDPFALGLVAAAQFAPVMVLGLFGGLIADHLPKRRTLVATQAVQMLLALALAVLTATGLVEVWQIIVLALLLGVSNAVDMPTRQAFVVEMVGRDDISERRRPQLGGLQRGPDRGTRDRGASRSRRSGSPRASRSTR